MQGTCLRPSVPYLASYPCFAHILRPPLHFNVVVLHSPHVILPPSKSSKGPEKDRSEGTSELEFILHDEEAYDQNGNREWDRDCPKQPLSLRHRSEISCVHSHHARDERERKKDDCDGGKDVNSFGVVFSSHTDRVSGLLNRELLAPIRVS
jgi:hypothetical protein